MKSVRFFAIIGAALCLCLSACVHSAFAARYSGNLDEGLAYYLPKTALKVTVTYTLREETALSQGMESKTSTVLVAKPVKVVPILVPDPKNAFLVSGENISKDIFLEAGLNFKLDENGILMAIDSDVADKTAETLQSLVSAGIKIASIASIAGSEGAAPPELIDTYERIAQIFKEMGSAFKSTSPDKLAKVESLKKELEKANEVVNLYKAQNKKTYSDMDIEYTTTLDTSDFAYDEKAGLYKREIAVDGLIPGKMAPAMPAVVVKLLLAKDDYSPPDGASAASMKGKGIVYRFSRPVMTMVCVGASGTVVFRDLINYPQFGGLARIPVDSKGGTTRKTSIGFSPKTGNLLDYDVKTGSSSDSYAKALNASLDSVQKAIIDIKYDLKAKDLDWQAKLADAEKALLDSKADLETAKKAYEDATQKKP